jgi:SAM-dependent methyltransferase
MIDSTQRFSDRVEYYARARPTYPAALLRFFQDELGLLPAHAVADIGAGTGLLTELFVRNGNVTYAVEPNDPMRAAAETRLGKRPNFHSIRGAAEATTLADASVHFVTAAQAFHWFKPQQARQEFRRILDADGIVALIWNERHRDESPFVQGYRQIIERYQTAPQAARPRGVAATNDPTLQSFFGPGGCAVRTFDNPQLLDRAGLLDRIASSSNMPLPPDVRHEKIVREANALFEACQEKGTVRLPQETWVYFGRLRA